MEIREPQEIQFLNRIQKDLLVTGYVREQCIKKIPNDIMKLCFKFLDDTIGKITWKLLSKKALHQFFSVNTKEDIVEYNLKMEKSHKQTIVYKNIKFICSLFYDPQHVQTKPIVIEVELYRLDKNIESVIFYYQFKCHETNTMYKDIYQFAEYSSSISQQIVNRDQCDVYRESGLEFSCTIDILRIKYINNTNKYEYQYELKSMNQSIYNHKINYKWHVTNDYIQKFKYYNIGHILYRDDFGDNDLWCIKIRKIGENNMNLKLKLIGCLPMDLELIKIKYIFQIIDLMGKCVKGMERISFREISYNQNEVVLWNDLNIRKLNEFIVSLEIQLLDS